MSAACLIKRDCCPAFPEVRKTKPALLYRIKDTPPGVWKTHKLKNTTLKTLREHVRKIHGDKLEMIVSDDIEAAADFDMASIPAIYEQMLA